MGAGPREAESTLYSAIAAGDLDTVKQEISRDSSLLNTTEGGFDQTPLHRAVRAKQVAVAQFLLESGADPNVMDGFNLTPLAVAMDAGGSDEMIRLLEVYGGQD